MPVLNSNGVPTTVFKGDLAVDRQEGNGPESVLTVLSTSAGELAEFGVPDIVIPDSNILAMLSEVGVSVLAVGSSIEQGTGSSNASTKSWPALTGRALTNKRKVWGSIRRGYPGQTSSYILAQVEGLLKLNRPRCLIVGAGFFTNDIEQVVPIATSKANIEAMRQLAEKYNTRIEVCKTIPMGSAKGTTKAAAIGALNNYLSIYCAIHGILLHDTFSAVADPTTGYIATTFNYDDVHLNDAGYQAISDVVSANSMSTLGILPWPVTALGGGGLLPAGFEAMTSQWVNITGTATATLALEPAATGTELITGQWMTASLASAGFRVVGKGFGTLGDGNVSVGDKLLICGQFSVTASLSTKSSFCLYKASSSLIASFIASNIESPQTIMETYTLQAADTGTLAVGMQPTCAAGETVKARVGGVGVINLTALGIADLFG